AQRYFRAHSRPAEAMLPVGKPRKASSWSGEQMFGYSPTQRQLRVDKWAAGGNAAERSCSPWM
ncbi:hypothetical protein M513_05449, partial [Trichuris suis]